MKFRLLPLFDYAIFFASILLIIIGITFIYSSGVNSDGVNVMPEYYTKQIAFASIGLLWLAAAALFDYRKFQRYAVPVYIGLIGILIYTRLFGKVVYGAKSWLGIGIFGIQPSEFGKIVFIIFLAWYLEQSHSVRPIRRFITALAILLLPMGLILLQPDLGTASVYLPVFLVMCFIAGIPLKFLLLVLLGGMMTIVFTVLPIWETEIYRHTVPILQVLKNDRLRMIVIAASGSITVIGIIGFLQSKNKYFYWIAFFFSVITLSLAVSSAAGHMLKDYQVKRLIIFLNPDSDPLGAGWNIIQSKIAIGSGNILGRGFLQGTQSHYRFLPQQHTDFIFSILSEEWGFIGGMAVYALYLLILIRTMLTIKNTPNVFGTYIASGIFGMFFFHFVVNVGMVMGIMPITGIPLLFLSYGGTALWTAMICIGLLMGISARRLDINDAY